MFFEMEKPYDWATAGWRLGIVVAIIRSGANRWASISPYPAGSHVDWPGLAGGFFSPLTVYDVSRTRPQTISGKEQFPIVPAGAITLLHYAPILTNGQKIRRFVDAQGSFPAVVVTVIVKKPATP